MEECKWRYLKDFLAWSELSLEDLIGVAEMEETRLRNCYAEAIELSSDVFVKMMLLDAAFIIMIILKNSFLDFQSSNDRIFSRPWMIHDIRFDMILLENQLPFFFFLMTCLSYPSLIRDIPWLNLPIGSWKVHWVHGWQMTY